MSLFHKASVALVPYWLKDQPQNISDTDHAWWFEPLMFYDIVVYTGPHVEDTVWRDAKQKGIGISTQGYSWHIDEILPKLNKYGLSESDFTLVWNVLEASATCRAFGLEKINSPKIAVIADTHHLRFPITSLLSYLVHTPHTYVLATHNQHAPFFGAYLQIPAIGWPFTCKASTNNYMPQVELDKIYYYGNTLSPHHKQRSLIVNYSLLRSDIHLVPRLSFDQWLQHISVGGKIILGCTLNGSPSFQTYYSLLNYNLLISDPIAPSSWLGSLMRNHKICMTYRSKEECIAIIESLRQVRESPKMAKMVKSMIRIAADQICKCINNPKQYGLAFLDPENKLTSIKTTTTELDSYTLTHLNLILYELGLDHLLLTIKMFEILQEQHRKTWTTVLILDAGLHECEINFWANIRLLLPRVLAIRSADRLSECKHSLFSCTLSASHLRFMACNI
jgi:hypothetical protein